MNFLFPAMLAGLVGAAIPIALHLIAKHKFPVQDFPTLRLLAKDERTNVFAPKLIDPWQLLLRLLVLLLLALAMSRLFIPGFGSSPAPRNLVVVVDASASMNLQVQNPQGDNRLPALEVAVREARKLLEEINPPSQSALVVAGDQTRVLASLQPGHEAALAALPLEGPDRLQATDGSGQGLLNAISTAADLVRGRREVKSQIVVLTDLRNSSFATRNQKNLESLVRTRSDLGDKLDLIFVDLASGATENLAITATRVRDGKVKVGDDAHVLAHVQNSGTKEKTAKLQLSVGNQPDPAITEVTLEPGAEAIVDLTTPVNRAVRTIADVRIKEPDALIADDVSSVPLNVSESRRVLIVNGSTQAEAVDASLGNLGQTAAAADAEPEATVDGATILRYVLNPGRELGRASGTGIDTTVTSPEAVATQTLSKFELIVLYDVTSLPAQALADIQTFVRDGRSLLIVSSGGVNALQFNRIFYSADPQKPGLSPAQLGNDQDLTPALGLTASTSSHPWLAPFRDPLQGDLSTIHFTKIRELPALTEGASLILTTTDGRPLAVEMPLGKGRVVLLAFGFELNRGNLGRTRVFPTLMWRLVDYLTGQLRALPPDSLTALQPAVLDVSEPAFAFATELELTPDKETGKGEPMKLAVSPQQTVVIPPLPAGNYQLHKPRIAGAVVGHTRNLTVHTDARESDMARTTEPQMTEWLEGPVRVVAIKDTANLAPTGGEFWKLFLWLLVIAYVAEAITGYILSAMREKTRAAEGNA